MPYYYLLWIGESAHELHAPHCELATGSEYTMYEFCKSVIDKCYAEGQYVVMTVKTISGPSDPNGKRVSIFTQTTCSVSEFMYEFDKEN